MAHGFLARVFEVFDRHRTAVDLIATSEVSISLTVDDPARLPAIQADLAPLGEVQILPPMAIVSVVGRGFAHHSGIAARLFEALRDVNIVMISFGASDVNVSLVVAAEDAERAVRAPPSRHSSKEPPREDRRRRPRQDRTTRWRPSSASGGTSPHRRTPRRAVPERLRRRHRLHPGRRRRGKRRRRHGRGLALRRRHHRLERAPGRGHDLRAARRQRPRPRLPTSPWA